MSSSYDPSVDRGALRRRAAEIGRRRLGTQPLSPDLATRRTGLKRSDDQAVAARRRLASCTLIAGFHPDQATEPLVDLALALRVPFATVPCCVFPQEFPERRGPDGRPVKTHAEFVAYLLAKHPAMRAQPLAFTSEAGTAKNVTESVIALTFIW